MAREIENAKITSTFLGREDHGIMTAYVNVQYDTASHQGFGGYALDKPVGEKGVFRERQGVRAGMEFVVGVLGAVGVDSWEELKGKHVRIDHDWSKIYRVGHIIENKWFDPVEMFDRVRKEDDELLGRAKRKQ